MEDRDGHHHVMRMHYLNARDALGEEEYERCLREEVWRPVVGWEGLYEVSSWGRARSLDRTIVTKHGVSKRHTGRVLKMTSTNQTHNSTNVVLAGDSKRTLQIPHIIMEAFVGPRPLGFQVAHNDGNRFNNMLSNLRYATPIDNNQDKVAHGTLLRGSRIGNSKLTENDVIQIYNMKGKRSTYYLANQYNVSPMTISRIHTGQRWRHLTSKI